MSPSITFASETTSSQRRSSIYSPPKKSTTAMTISQKYFLAHQARGKLSRAAGKADHDLRILCGHANLLDNLMIDLANAEQAQEQWFNKSLSGSRQEKPVVQHEDSIMEESEADWEAEEAQSEEDSSDDEDFVPIRDTDMEEDEDEFESSLALIRTTSRPVQSSPPELTHEDDSDSEDDHMPPSPPNVAVEKLSAKQASTIDTSIYYPSPKPAALESENFYLPTREQPTIIAAY